MSGNRFYSGRAVGRKTRRYAVTALEDLEDRTVQATGFYGAGAQIVGQVVNESTGQGVPRVVVQLFNQNGRLVNGGPTNSQGLYLFNVTQPGYYVVREITPRGYVQLSPTFAYTAPVGSYAPGAGAGSWNYTSTNTNPALGPVGPAAWSTISPAGADGNESPVNLTGRTVDLSKYLNVHYNDAVPTDIIDNGHQIQVQYPGNLNDYVTVGDVPFALSQFHYHGPAENTVNGHTYTAEEHFVNVSASGAEAVVAVFLKLGAHNGALDPILDSSITGLTKPNSKTSISTPIDFPGLLPKNPQGWFYRGSLTTPPLSQPVNWFVFSTPITVDATQLYEYQYVANAGGFFPNARPTQPLDGRILNQNNNLLTVTSAGIYGANFGIIA